MRDVIGYEDLYIVTPDGKVMSKKRELYLKPFYSKDTRGNNKYLRVALSKNGVKNKFFIHRLVADAYLEKKDGRDYINHIDGDKTNNKIDNLEWCTLSENTKHSYDNNLHKGLIGIKQKRNSSGYVGVTRHKNKWKAQIRFKNELFYLGLFDTAKEASKAYNKKLKDFL